MWLAFTNEQNVVLSTYPFHHECLELVLSGEIKGFK